jgi:hypothetical protein
MASDGQDYLHQSLGQAKKPHGCIVTIFGASGDLTKRKLIPALYNLALEKKLPERFAVVGYARSEMSHEAFRDKMREAVHEFSRTGLKDPRLGAVHLALSTSRRLRRGRRLSKPKEFIDASDRQPVLPGRSFIWRRRRISTVRSSSVSPRLD